jgi:N6-L-threonylcarbamoyladenine synthase
MIHNTKYKILSIDTSCDETSAAVTMGTKVLSNIIWSQASLHAKFGGVMPSLAQREHEARIDWVINKSISNAKCQMLNVDAMAVTVGPGLAIALGVGINKAKELVKKFNKPLIAINHLEGHVLSALAHSKNDKWQMTNAKLGRLFPALGLVVSGGNTQLILIEKIGKYKILAETQDDALGEALDKAARMLGLGYPGGAILEKFARSGNPKTYSLPIPLVGQEERKEFSYSGLKTAFYRLLEEISKEKGITKKQIYDLSASYQNIAFEHIIRVTSFIICHLPFSIKYLFVGGGVAANVELRKRLRKMCKKYNIVTLFPYSNKLYGDNAAMIGVAAYFKAQRKEFIIPDEIDRIPNFKLN